MSKITDELAEKLEATLTLGITENAIAALKKTVADILYDVESDIDYRLRDTLAPNLTDFVVDMAEKTVEAILKGDEAQMRRYLGCERGHWTGRSDSPALGFRVKDMDEWHPVIHGKLFDRGAMTLRREIVAAHRDLIASERILDLEDQVASLIAQVNKLTAEKERLGEQLRYAS